MYGRLIDFYPKRAGAVQLSLPTELVERLKLIEVGHVRAYAADGSEHRYRVMGIAEVQGRSRQRRRNWSPTQDRPMNRYCHCAEAH